MRNLLSTRGWLVAAAFILLPVTAYCLTGIVVSPNNVKATPAPSGYGKIAVRFALKADDNRTTQWRLVTPQGPGDWVTVTKSTVAVPPAVEKRVDTYGIEFQRVPVNAPDKAPRAQTVTIVEGQLVTLNVKFVLP